MSEKCECCKKSNKTRQYKKIDYTTSELLETLHWFCSPCVNIMIEKSKIPVRR